MPTKQRSNKKQKVSNDVDYAKDKTLKKNSQIAYEKSSQTASELKYICKEEPTDDNNDGKLNSIGFVPVPDKFKSNKVSTSLFQSDVAKVKTDKDKNSDEETERRIEENEQFIIDLLSKTQPHHDHCYTTIFGPRNEADILSRYLTEDDADQNDKDAEEDECRYLAGNKRVMYMDRNGCAVKNPTPILFLRHRSPDENVPMVSVEVIIPQDIEEEDIDVVGGIESEEMSLSSGESKSVVSFISFENQSKTSLN